MNKLWVRLAVAFLSVTFIAVAVIGIVTDWNAAAGFRQFLVHEAMMAPGGLADDLSDYYSEKGNWVGVASVFSETEMMPTLGRGRGRGTGRGMGMQAGGRTITFADADGRVVYDESGTRMGGAINATERANAIPVTANGNTVGYLVATSSRAATLAPEEQSFLDDLRRTLLLAGVAAGALGILIGLVMSRALAAPLNDLAQTARAFARRDWSHRVKVRGTDEVAMVAREFNAMADAISSAETHRRNMMADIAHELRTPLAVLQGNLGAMLDDVYPIEHKEIATLYDETRLLSRLVDDLRELALAESGHLQLNLQSVDLSAITRAAAANFAAAADAQSVQLVADGNEPLHVRADPDRLAQVLRNLLANALRYTPSGGRITLQSEVAQDGKSARVTVADNGEGIAAEDLPHLFDRFYRGDKSRTRASGGSGLGLAITKTLVQAMGGGIGVSSEPGQGSHFWFTIPKD